MSDENQAHDPLTQLAVVVLQLVKAQAEKDAERTKAYVGNAVKICQKEGYGDALAMEIFNKAFPGQSLPIGMTYQTPISLSNKS